MTNATEFTFTARVLLQVDLEGHSAWIAAAASQPDVVRARVELAECLGRSLAAHRFELLSWKGDGGVYESRPESGTGDLDFAVTAASAAAQQFSAWRSAARDRSPLRFRISVHFAADVYVHQNRGYWASDDLNVFIKHEREIGVSGTIAVTDVVHRHLSKRAQLSFTASRTRHLGARPDHVAIRTVYYAALSAEAAMNKTNPIGFFEWLRAANLPGAIFADPLIGPSVFVRASIGDGCVLFAAPHPDSQLSLDFVKGSTEGSVDLTPDEQADWVRLQEEIRQQSKLESKEDGKKISPFRIVRPLSDIPLARIHYEVESWSRARGFHLLLSQRPALLKRLARGALELLDEGTRFPGIACCHMIVRTAEAIDGTPTVLFCQRQRKGHDDTYHAGQWSLTCEEQMRPGEDVETCVNRGLAEELLGSHGTAGLTIRILGAVLERSLLNLSIIVLVDVPMTFEEIVQSWQLAVAKDEHYQLTHFAPDRELYRQFAAGGEVPAAVTAILKPSHPDTRAGTRQWVMHPTTLVRLAFVLWAHEVLSRRAA